MAQDVIITPANGQIDFQDDNVSVAKIDIDSSNNLSITNSGGDLSIGNTSSDVYIGDGTNNVDLIFEQNGSIRGTGSQTITLGQSGDTISVAGSTFNPQSDIVFTTAATRGIYFNNTSGNQVYVRLLGSTELDLGSDNRIRFVETDGGSVRAVFDLNSGKAKVGNGASETPVATWQIEENNESTTQTDFTQAVTKAGLLMETQYTADAYTPGLFWITNNNNATKPKAGIYLQLASSGSRMLFGTSNNYGTGLTNTAMLINESGNVGIGTETPTTKLHVYGNNNVGNLPNLAAQFSATGTGGLGIGDENGNEPYIGLLVATDDFHIKTGGNNKRVTILSSGSVGIGTTSPAYPLDVKTASVGAMQVKGAETHGLLLGEAAYSQNNDYTGLKTSLMTGSSDYMIISGSTTDGNTYVSAKSGNNLHLRAGGNSQNDEIVISASTGVTYKSSVQHEFSTGNVGINTSTTNVKLAVGGQASFGSARQLSLIGLAIASSSSSPNIKIRTKIPFASSSADFTVNIKGFIYGNAETANLTVCWHYYNSTFYNATCSSAGSWAPTIQLSAEDWDSSGTKKVCICLSTPGYWVKAYVESMYSNAYGDAYTAGWTWVDETASGTGNDLASPSYRSDFGNNFKMLSNGCVGMGGGILTNAQLTVNGAVAIGDATYNSNMNNGAADFSVDCNGTSMISWIGNYLQVGGTGQNWSMKAYNGLLQTYSNDLTIIGGGTGTTHKLHLGTNGQTQTITCNNGSVGIGTNSPDSLLMVYKSGADSIIHVRGASNGGDARVRINGYNSSELYLDRNGVGRFAFRRTTGTDDLSLLKLNDDYSDNSTIMFWDYSSGNVGVGTASPAYKLEVEASVTGDWVSRINNTATTNTPNGVIIKTGYNASTATGGYLFACLAGTDYRFAVQNDGNVGVGSILPTATLDVNGTGKFSSHLTLAGDATSMLYFGSKRAIEGQIANNNLDFGESFANIRLRSSSDVFPTNSVNLGTSSNRWSTIYGSAGDFSGVIVAASGSTNGGPWLERNYSAPHKVNVLSSHYSSGNTIIGYGAAGKSGGSGYVATYGNFSGNKSIIELSSSTLTFKVTDSPAQDTVGDDITLNTRLYVDKNSLTYTSSDGSGLIVNRTSVTAYLQLFPSYSNVPTIMGKGQGGLHLGYNSNTSGIRIDTSNNVIIKDNILFFGSTSGPFVSNDSTVLRLAGDGGVKIQTYVSGWQDRLTIIDDGNVGINTTSPSAKLHIESDGSHDEGAEIVLRHGNNNTTDIVSTISFQNAGGQVAMIQGETVGGNTNGEISFHTDNAGTSAEAMRIDSDHRVQLKATDFQLRYTSGSHIWYNRLRSNGTFAIHKNGVGDYLRVDSSGNVGLGLNALSSANLHVYYSSGVTDIKAGFLSGTAGPGIRGQNTSTTANTYFPIDFRVHDADARIAFQYSGTSNQGQFLFITENNTSSPSFGIYDRGNDATRVQVNDTTSTTTPNKTFEVRYANTSTDVTQQGLSGGGVGDGILIYNTQASDNVYANLDFRARDADGRIAYQYKNATNVGDFHFITDNNASPASKMTILNGGNVGIGTTNPSAPLEVYYSGSSSVPGIVLTNTNNGGTSSIVFRDDGGTRKWACGYNDATNDWRVSQSSGSSSGNLEYPKLVVRDGGNVGIGYTFPSGKLAVNGSVGVGTSSPGSQLQVNGDIQIQNTGSNSFTFIGNKNGPNPYFLNGTTIFEWITYNSAQSAVISYFGLATDSDGQGLICAGTSSYTPRIAISASTGNVGIGTASNSSYKLQVSGSFAASSKNFVIDHPTKENKQLVHGSLEGPENGVYYRGRAQSSTISLPDYWSGLVREDTITVQLTPRGGFQHLYVVSASLSQIVIGAAEDETIDCFYTIYGERADIDSLVVEKDV